MFGYPARIAEKLLPLSIAGTLKEAIKEWRFTEIVEDHYEPVEVCELCGQQDLRYHFEIANDLTREKLWVGSHCILQFQVPVYEDGILLGPKEAKAKLDKLTEKMQFESCILALEKLASAENNDILTNALAYYKRNKKLTPKFAFVVFWRLKQHAIDYRPSFFAIDLKKKKYAKDLEEMETSRVHFFWQSLTASQRKRAIEMGHLPPPTAPSHTVSAIFTGK